MESTGNRLPLNNLNRQISTISQNLKGLSTDMQDIRQKMRSVVEYATHKLTNADESSSPHKCASSQLSKFEPTHRFQSQMKNK